MTPDRFHGFASRLVAIALIAACLPHASAQLVKGRPAPALKAVDIHGEPVDLDAIVGGEPQPKLLVEFLFSTSAGDEIANKLAYLYTRYGKEMLQVIGLGMEEDKAALRTFAEGMGITYFIIDASTLKDADWLDAVNALPVTIFIYPDDRKSIAKVIQGGGEEQANIIKEIASNFLAQGLTKECRAVAEAAAENGEPEGEAKDLVGYSFILDGDTDSARDIFAETKSTAGNARLAMELGNLDEAEAILAKATAPDGYSTTLMGTVRMLQGKVDEAGEYFAKAAGMPSDDWQLAEAYNGQGRMLHAEGDVVAALATYEQAIAENPFDVTALTNAAEVLRARDDLEKAAELLKQAEASPRADGISEAMLRQVLESTNRANDVQRAQLVAQQIGDLGARYKELKASGEDKPVDPWSSRPLVLAFLPSAEEQVFFARAGLDTVIQRELEFVLQQRGDVTVVEREFLDQLLQELSLSANDLTRADTKQQLGQVLAARWLGVIEYVGAGNQIGVYARLADAESTSLVAQVTRNFDARADLSKMIHGMADELMANVAKEQGLLQGLIVDASDESAILINLGQQHGVAAGQRFDIVEMDPPMQVGARDFPGRLKRLGAIEVTAVAEDTATAKLIEKKDGVTLAPESKLRQAQ